MTGRVSFAPHPSVDPRCAHCQGRSYVVTRSGPVAAARLCSCTGVCPLCDDTGFVDRPGPPNPRGRTPKVRCRCSVVKDRIDTFNAARIPARMRNAARTTFRPLRDNMDAFVRASALIEHWNPDGDNRGLVLYGDVGRGKTHLLVALVRDLVFERGVRARFVEFTHLLSEMKAHFDRKQGVSGLLDELATVEVLALDELGKGRNTEFEQMVVDELISRRYNAGLTLLATSNFPPGPPTGLTAPDPTNDRPWPDGWPALVDRVGTRVMSRLREVADFTRVGGPDHRLRAR